jgi:signal transduction histidine kinase/CheY-like chemotaxis protein
MSLTTLIVLTANGSAAVIAAGMLMLVLWQAPHQRANQLFALTMLALGAYCVANSFGRFIDDLSLDPRVTTYLAIMLYALFAVAMFFFTSEFATAYTPVMRAMRIAGVVLIFTQNLALWSDNVLVNIRPRGTNAGDYQGDWQPLGLLSSGLIIAYLLLSAAILRCSHDDRARSLWPAPLWVVGGLLSSMIIWPRVPVPLNAVLLAVSALALGLPVLRHELFNPLANMNAELAQRNVDLEEASRMKSQFLANMSHELRTPLNSIIGYTELVLNGTYGALNDVQHDRLSKVVRNGHNLLALINDVLDLNRIEAGHVALDRRELDTAALLEHVLITIEPLAAHKGLRIVRDFDGAPPLYADETRIHQIVTNILANAIKFTDQGSVTIRARAENSMVQLVIADTGIGIAPDQRDAVFAEFQQVDNSSTRRYEGTGLGMAITKRLVELHGGTIGLDSTPGQGTTFYVNLPGIHTPQVLAIAPAGPQIARTVLVIDDHAEAVEMLSDTLGSAGYRVLHAQSGSEGLARARQLGPDLITLDVMMPGMDGWQVLRALKGDPTTRDIPVVMVSIVDNRPLALDLGAADALTKPVDQQSLVAVLGQTLRRPQADHPVLVVDDMPDDRRLLVDMLQRSGYPVHAVSGGADALTWLAHHTPSLVLLDLMMPAISGFDVLAHIRSDDRLAALPVIVITAKSLTPDEADYLAQRRADLVQKGFAGPDALLRAVQHALGAPAAVTK